MTYTTRITKADLDRASVSLDGRSPVFMLNLLRYRDAAAYAGPTDLPACSGREAYMQRYVPAFNRLAADRGIGVAWIGNAHATIVAPEGETWDDIAIVEYPNFDALRNVIESERYRIDAEPHRLAALADWRFIAATKMGLPA